MKFSDNLRNLRREKEYSQEYLAEVMGVSRQTVSKWENGSAMPDLKKLTELAEFFGTNMDTLLGIEGAEDIQAQQAEYAPEIDFTPYIEHTERMFTAMTENQNRTNEKKHRTAITVLSLCLAVVTLIMIINSVNLNGQIAALRAQIASLSNNQTVVIDQYTDDYVITDDVECTLLKRNEETPWLVTVRMTFSPVTYANDTVVSFDFVGRDGYSKTCEAQLENGIFRAEAEVDLTKLRTAYINLNDGSSTERGECYLSLVWDYIQFDGELTFDISASKDFGKKQTEYRFNSEENRFGNTVTERECAVYFSDSICGEITKAELVIQSENETLLTKPLEWQPAGEENSNSDLKMLTVPPVSFESEKDYNGDFDIFVELTDKMGVRYRYLADHNDGAAAITVPDDEGIIILFTVDGTEVAVSSANL